MRDVSNLGYVEIRFNFSEDFERAKPILIQRVIQLLILIQNES